MSWFTATAKTQPICPRCSRGSGAVFVAHNGEFDIYDCRACGAVLSKQDAVPARVPRRPWGSVPKPG